MSDACAPGHVYTVVYDGSCNVCQKIVTLLTRWDRNHELEIVASETPDLAARFPWIPAGAYAEYVNWHTEQCFGVWLFNQCFTEYQNWILNLHPDGTFFWQY